MEKKGVLVIGSVNMDMVVKADHFPLPGETILGESFQMFPGGKGANQAVASAKLGSDTFFVGRFGSDVFKDKIFESMQADGVDLSGIFIDYANPTGIAMITVDHHGENQIVVISGSNMKLSLEDIEARIPLFRRVKVVLAQLEIPIGTVLRSAHLAKENGAMFILNPAPALTDKLPDELLKLTTYITPNEVELERLTSITIHSIEDIKKAGAKLLSYGVKNVIVTMGSKGAFYISDDKTLKVKAKPVDVIDTTGAGDAFNGALASALSENYKIEEAIEFANLAAAISVTRMGAQSSMPGFNEILELQRPHGT
ncbi:MAG: ribokinase [Bacteroidota bacterium]|nr:ribokinase [Bacteroidota bacterium]MDP4190242.1 ribokinase [Bacteroidota bacterium]MDP4195560.1 ribokinase [Bacteroidota bacterium]